MVVRLNLRMNKVGAELKMHLSKGMAKALLYLDGVVKQSIGRGNVTGLFPSAAGEPPKRVTGTLINHVAFEQMITATGIIGNIGIRAGAADKYAKALEFGTSKMEERPYIRPAVYNNQAKILRFLIDG